MDVRALLGGLVIVAAVSLAATCVLRTDQIGDAGPWTGVILNANPQVMQGAGVTARVTDADGGELPLDGQPLAPACPSALLPGEHGAYELAIGDQPGADLPLRAQIMPLDADATAPPMSGAGLNARVLSTIDRSATVEIQNNGTVTYRGVVLCSVVVDATHVVSVEYVTPPDRILAPGERDIVRVRVPRGEDVRHRIYPLGEPERAGYGGVPTDWRAVAIGGAFTVMLPPGWEYVPLQGIDSFVGELRGGGISISFDYGIYTGDGLVGDSDPEHDVRYERIGGFESQVVLATTPAGVTGVHVNGIAPSSLGPAVTLSASARDLTPGGPEQAQVIEILRTVRFPYQFE